MATVPFRKMSHAVRPVCWAGAYFGKQQQAYDLEPPTRPPTDTRPLPDTGGASPPSESRPLSPASESRLQQLQAMGFQRQQAAAALAVSGGDVMAAANMLAGDSNN